MTRSSSSCIYVFHRIFVSGHGQWWMRRMKGKDLEGQEGTKFISICGTYCDTQCVMLVYLRLGQPRPCRLSRYRQLRPSYQPQRAHTSPPMHFPTPFFALNPERCLGRTYVGGGCSWCAKKLRLCDAEFLGLPREMQSTDELRWIIQYISVEFRGHVPCVWGA